MGGLPSTVTASNSAATAGEPPAAPLPRYPLRSNSQSSLLLHSHLRSPHRTRPRRNNLVLETFTGVSITMSGTHDPAAMDAKLDRTLGQLTTITNRLNSHDHRLVRIESGKADAGKGAVTDDAASGGDDIRTGRDNTRDGGDAHDDDMDQDRA